MKNILIKTLAFCLIASQVLAWGGTGYDINGLLYIPPAGANYLKMLGDLQFTSNSPPVVSSCGSGTLVTGSTDNKGQISGITAATACTITFSQALPAAPSCQFNTNSAIVPTISTVSTSAVTTTMTALTGTLYYVCF